MKEPWAYGVVIVILLLGFLGREPCGFWYGVINQKIDRRIECKVWIQCDNRDGGWIVLIAKK